MHTTLSLLLLLPLPHSAWVPTGRIDGYDSPCISVSSAAFHLVVRSFCCCPGAVRSPFGGARPTSELAELVRKRTANWPTIPVGDPCPQIDTHRIEEIYAYTSPPFSAWLLCLLVTSGCPVHVTREKRACTQQVSSCRALCGRLREIKVVKERLVKAIEVTRGDPGKYLTTQWPACHLSFSFLFSYFLLPN
jgi:hypothetical protein